MRWSMRAALFGILLGFTILVVAIWVRPLPRIQEMDIKTIAEVGSHVASRASCKILLPSKIIFV
jgi:hypothetical protein